MINKYLLSLLILFTIGCTNQPPQPPAAPTFTHTITIDTKYYTDGPQQAHPPDGTMKAGTKVTVVEDAGSYLDRHLDEYGSVYFDPLQVSRTSI